ncbi:MAG: aspartate/tyrosine/aromatic aminotransferase [Deltaproteobacteria bacterium]|nr:aspartate/tyrosine/aromatic aminotransferase [Deltaproteobacteria bacterium]
MSFQFAAITAAPADPILGIRQKFLADANPRKVDLSVGVYQNEKGETPLLEVVREARQRLLTDDYQAGYLPIDGLPGYNQQVQKLLFGGDAQILEERRAVTIQSVGGTSALRYGADFLRRHYPQAKLFLSDPSWDNHRPIFERAGFEVGTYPYYEAHSGGLNFAGMLSALESMPEGSVVLLHTACHNPTGLDPHARQWQQLIELFKERRLIAFLDFAYQGFGRGLEEDAFAVRLFAEAGLCFLVASSFSKNFSLYRRRTGALTVAAADEEQAKRVLSQIKTDVRTNNSNPPVDGAAIVNLVLGDKELRSRWEGELAAMRARINQMRALLVEKLSQAGLGDRFGHIAGQTGMFSYSGLTPAQVERLEKDFGIYALSSGRICVAALNTKNLDYVTEAIVKTARQS